MRHHIPILTLWVVALTAGCSPGSGSSGRVLQYTEATLQSRQGGCDSTGGGCVTVTLRYPALATPASGPLRDTLEAYVRPLLYLDPASGETVAGFQDLVSSVMAQNRDLRRKFPDYRIDWYLERTVSVLADTGGLVTLRSTETTFLGGAHPLTTVRFATFDAVSGRRLGMSDCIAPESDRAFAMILEAAFRKARGISPETDLQAEGFWVEKGGFAVTQNFGVRPDGLVFYYNPYEIAPYAMGPTEVLVSFHEVAGMLPGQGKVARLAGQ